MSVTEEDIAKITVAPRITLDQVKANIKDKAFHRLTPTLTVCVVALQNGFTVTGESACASPENYNEEIGNSIALENACNKIWALMGYELRSKLVLLEKAAATSDPSARTYIGTKIVHARPMTRGLYNEFRGWDLPLDENSADEGYLFEDTNLPNSNHPAYVGYISWMPKREFETTYGEPL